MADPPAPNPADIAACDRLLATYLEAAASADPATAAACWRPSDIAAAARLGSTYTDAPFKLDSDSPA